MSTIYVFPEGKPGARWFRIEVPLPEDLAEELLDGQRPAWVAMLDALEKFCDAAK